MNFIPKPNHMFYSHFRYYGTKMKIEVNLKPTLEEKIQNRELSPRKHPGVMKVRSMPIPPQIEKAINAILKKDASLPIIVKDSEHLSNRLQRRLPPLEMREMHQKTGEVFKKFSKNELRVQASASDQQIDCVRMKQDKKAQDYLKKHMYNWEPIKYDRHTSNQYLFLRAAPEYAILCRILGEINSREPDFKPDSFFDFGSGVGTAIWAARHFWEKSILEYFTVDISQEMNDLSKLILCDGNENKHVSLKAFYQRQFLPTSSSITYDVVVSAFSLFELPSAKARLETIGVLWRKTNHFLVLVEQGTNAGFKLINEARDYILQLEGEANECHVFAPCPADLPCPRFKEGKTPCNFIISYSTLNVGKRSTLERDLFSYLVIKKGKRKDDDPQWPRIVRVPLVRSKHAFCRVCTSEGNLEEIIFTKKKYGLPAYWCAKSSNWGDLLPASLTKKSDVSIEPLTIQTDKECQTVEPTEDMDSLGDLLPKNPEECTAKFDTDKNFETIKFEDDKPKSEL